MKEQAIVQVNQNTAIPRESWYRSRIRDPLMYKGVDLIVPHLDRLTKDRLFYNPGREAVIGKINDGIKAGMHVFVAGCGHEAWPDAIWMTRFLSEVQGALGKELVKGIDISAAKGLIDGQQGYKMQRLARPFGKFFEDRSGRLVMVRRAKDEHGSDDERSDRLSDDIHVITSAFIEGGMEGGRDKQIEEAVFDRHKGVFVTRTRYVQKGLQGIHPEDRNAKITRILLKRQFDDFERNGGLLIVPFVMNGGKNMIHPTSQKVDTRAVLAIMGMYPRNLISAIVCEPISLKQIVADLKSQGKQYTADTVYDSIMEIAAKERPIETRGDYRYRIRI